MALPYTFPYLIAMEYNNVLAMLNSSELGLVGFVSTK